MNSSALSRTLNLVWALVLALTLPAAAQVQGGNISGIVRDEQGAAVPGSDVAVQGADATFRAVTERDGAFRFLNLEPGGYRITATLAGFRAGVRDVVVAVGKNVDAPIELRVAPVRESVTVTAPAPMLDARM